MELQEYTDLAKLRLSIAKEYLDRLKEKMGEHLLYAYIYGSTAKNCPKEKSDVDVIVVVKKPSREEKCLMNSLAGGLFENGRNGVVNFAFNSHFLLKIRDELGTKHGIDISPYYYYQEDGHEAKLRHAWFSLAQVLSGPHLVWPRDFEGIAYL